MATANCVRENYFTHHTVDECDKPAQYYNLSFYKCEPLDEEENFVPSTSGVYYQCDPKYKPTDYKLMMPESCEKCSDNQIYVPSLDDCVKCDESTSLCSCNNREYRRFIRATIPEDPENPTITGSLTCERCSAYTFVLGEDPTKCLPCKSYSSSLTNHPCGTLLYPHCTIGTTLIPIPYGTDDSTCTTLENLFRNSNYQIALKNIDVGSTSSKTITLSGLNTRLAQSAHNCKEFLDAYGCQTLANLCVLAYYDENNLACRAYKEIYNALGDDYVDDTLYPGWKRGLPWLYYTIYGKAVSESSNLNTKYAFDSNTLQTSIDLVVARYSLDGTFLGYSPFDSEGFLCRVKSIRDTDDIKRLGHNYFLECEYDLRELYDLHETIFYELYIKRHDGTPDPKLLGIPIWLRNYDTAEDKDNYRYVHRFFLYDNIAYKNANSGDAYLRWASRMRLRVKLNKDRNDEIYIPTLEIKYNERDTSTVNNTNAYSNCEFRMIYYQDYGKVLRDALIALIILTIFSLIIAAYRIYTWIKVNPSTPSNLLAGSYTFYAAYSWIFFIVHSWGILLFWCLFGISAYFYLFFKLAKRPYLFLPDATDYSSGYKQFDALFGTILAIHCICAILRIIQQSRYDIFLIDWEEAKPELRQGRRIRIVNAWREIFVANEFVEMMGDNVINVTMNYIIFIFFMFGLGWQWWNQERPRPSSTETINPTNVYLNFFVEGLVFWITALVDYLLKWMLERWFPPPIHDVVDLMSVTNVSMIIFDDILRGYYIHGRSMLGEADVSAEVLKKFLDIGPDARTRPRGLEGKDEQEELQTYEIYISLNTRLRYNELMTGELRKVQVNPQVDPNEDSLLIDNKGPKSEAGIRKFNVAEFFKGYISSLETPERTEIVIGDKTFLQSFFGISPVGFFENVNTGKSIFLRDKKMSFKWLSGEGLDFQMVFFRVLVFWFWDRLLDNMFYAISLTYILEKFVWWVRGILVENNLTSKCFVDDRFLS